MSADAFSENTEKFLCETYKSEWKLTNLLSYRKKKLVTPSFSPSPNLDVKFCFEVVFSEYTSSGGYLDLLIKLILVKLDGSSVPSSAKLEIEMKMQHLGGTLIKEYNKLPIVTVKDMDNYYFEEIHLSYKHTNGFYQSGLELNKDQTLVLKFRMILFGHLQNLPRLSSPMFYASSTIENSSCDIKSYKRSDENSDIMIRVASKLFLAHKAVLVQNSTVFKEMITRQPDSECTLVTDDESYPAFDCFLNYLYSDELEDISWPVVGDVYILSAKYEVDDLKRKCSDAIVPIISVDTVCAILKIAHDYGDDKLKEISTNFAVEHIRDVASSEEWKELITSHPLIGYEVTFSALNIKNT